MLQSNLLLLVQRLEELCVPSFLNEQGYKFDEYNFIKVSQAGGKTLRQIFIWCTHPSTIMNSGASNNYACYICPTLNCVSKLQLMKPRLAITFDKG